jgi:hypothetical protein
MMRAMYASRARHTIMLAALLMPTAAAGRGTCVVAGAKPASLVVTVAAKGATPFKLRVDGLAASIATGGLEQPATVTVRAPLAFTATIAADAIPARTKRAVDAASGLVHLAAATEKLTLHADVRGSRVEADVRLDGVELRGLNLPCDALTLDDVASPKLQLVDHEGGERASPAGKLLHLRGSPGGGPTMVVAVDDPAALELRVTEHARDWARVTTRWADGTTIAGWVVAGELAAPSLHAALADALPHAAPNCTLAPTTRENERIVEAPVAAGTDVYAARYLGAWAKVVDGKRLRVRVRPKDDWVEIVIAPGLASVDECLGSTVLLDAWIPRAAVMLPPDLATVAAPKPPSKP